MYLEYIGDNYEADMTKNADDQTTQEWWKLCKPCQAPLEDRANDEWWASMKEVVHHC